jgi:hypothetical protein
VYERLHSDDVRRALDELIRCLGVKEGRPFHDLIALLRKKNTDRCVHEIAAWLGLPIRIYLSYVPKDFRPGSPGSTDRFQTSSLARTDSSGHGIESITAQVLIPEHLPLYGTSGLRGYPIHVRVSENCHEHPNTFVAVMAHELSHVLLASLGHPGKDSELHTDLVPIIFGLGEAVRSGRRTVEITTSGDTTTTRTTTYGYLADSQFAFACEYAAASLRHRQREKRRLLQGVAQVHHRVKRASRSLATFRDCLQHLDRRRPTRMRREHALRLVELHARNYDLEWESRIARLATQVEVAGSSVRGMNHYTPRAAEQLEEHLRTLASVSEQLGQVTEAIVKDKTILQKYAGVIYRLRRALR